MAKIKVREVTIKESKGAFSIFDAKEGEKDTYDFDGLTSLRQLLSNEKAKILDAIKYKNPKSIYDLAKILERPFKSVFDDVKLLERFGFVSMISEKTKNRIRHRPEIAVDQIIIHVKI